jgi:uncharacterized NAD(P)/FAD-binding protein YdhS
LVVVAAASAAAAVMVAVVGAAASVAAVVLAVVARTADRRIHAMIRRGQAQPLARVFISGACKIAPSPAD